MAGRSLIERYHDAEKQVMSLGTHLIVQISSQDVDKKIVRDAQARVDQRQPIIEEMVARKAKLELFLADNRWEVAETESVLNDDEVQKKLKLLAKLERQVANVKRSL
jgi:hypothetical protein